MQSEWNIELDQVTLGYGQKIVLESISALLPAGQISVVLGGSGCGKSTLLRGLIGLMRPMSGTVRLGGENLFTLPQKQFRKMRRRMGVLFQDGALLGSLTVGENVGLPLSEHTHLSPAMIKEIVLHKLSLVGLADAYAYYPSELSGGMRKRAGLARALVTDPPILLCDEPTSGLDPISAAQMDMLLLNMKKRFPLMTMVVVTHDMASMQNIADNIVVLGNQKILFTGSLQELQQTRDSYLRQFLDRKAQDPNETLHGYCALSPKTQEEMRAALNAWQQ